MFAENLIRVKTAPKKITKKPDSRFAFIKTLTDKFYRDPYKWGVIKCLSFFALSVVVARGLTEIDILPAEPPAQSTPAAY